jgi:hypothetical protein
MLLNTLSRAWRVWGWFSLAVKGLRPFLHRVTSSGDTVLRMRGSWQDTTQFRQQPVNRPENELIGIMYQSHHSEGDIVISDASQLGV